MMGPMRKKWAAFLCTLLTLALCACGEKPAEDEAPPDSEDAGPYVLTVQVGGAQDTLDPAAVTARGGETVLYHLFENLLRWEDGGDGWAVLTNGQAESYTVETDYAGNATYTFTLREGIVWSNGKAVTAADFAEAWQRLADPANELPHRELMSAITGYGEVLEDGTPAPLGVSAPDSRTLVINLNGSPAWFLEEVCAGAYTMPACPAGGRPDARGTVTNGPYTAVSLENGEVTLERNASYYAPDPKGPEQIRFQAITQDGTDYAAFTAGELDLTADVPEDVLKTLAESGLWTPEPITETYGVMLNARKAPFDNASVRMAFHLAVDRDAVAAAAGKLTARPAPGIVPYGVSDYSQRPALETEAPEETPPDPNAPPEPEKPAPVCWDFRSHSQEVVTAEHLHNYQADLSYAQALLAQAGYSGGSGFPEVEYLYVAGSETEAAVARALQAMWKDGLGVSVSIRGVSQEEYDAALSPTLPEESEDGTESSGGEDGTEEDAGIPSFAMAAQSFRPLCSDAEVLLNRWHSGSEENVSGYASDAFDILLDAAKTVVSPDARDAYLHDAEAILLEDSPVIPVLCRGGSYQLADGLDGLYRAPDGVFFLYGIHRGAAAG